MKLEIAVLMSTIGTAVVIATLGYILVIIGRTFTQPETRFKAGSSMMLAGLALVLVGLLTAVASAILLFRA